MFIQQLEIYTEAKSEYLFINVCIVSFKQVGIQNLIH